MPVSKCKCPVPGCTSNGFGEKRNLVQHMNNDHKERGPLPVGVLTQLEVEQCTACTWVGSPRFLKRHRSQLHGVDAENQEDGEENMEYEFGNFAPGGDGNEEPLEEIQQEDEEVTELTENDLFFGGFKPIRAMKGDEAVAFSKMTVGILDCIVRSVQESDLNAEKRATLAFILCPSFLGKGNKGKRVSFMNEIIENENDKVNQFFATLEKLKKLASLERNLTKTNGYFMTRAQRRRSQQKNRQREYKRAAKTTVIRQDLISASSTGIIPFGLALKMQNLVRGGLLGKAVRALDDHIAHNSTLIKSGDITGDILAKLQALHPEEDPLVETLEEGDFPTLQLTEECILEALSNTERGSAVAFSSWTYELISLACNEDVRFLTGLKELLQLMMDGKLGSKEIWLASRLIPLQQAEGKIRPIAIGEVFYRLLGRVATHESKEEAASFLAPTQMGIGVPDGVGVAAHALQEMAKAALSPQTDKVLVALDIKSAFNSMFRAAILRSVKEKLPKLTRLFLWAYGEPTDLRDSTGNVMFQSASGVKQGDAAGGLFFNTTFTGKLDEVVAEMDGKVATVAIHDDTYLYGSGTDCALAIGILVDKIKAIGLDLAEAKCKVLRNEEMSHVDTTLQMTGTSEGIVALGVPIGTEEFITRKSKEMLTKHGAVLECIADLPPEMAVPILSSCVNGRPSHLLRTVHPDLIHDATIEWDKKMDQALIKIMKTTAGAFDDYSRKVRGLTVSRGGLGIKRLNLVRLDAYMASYWSACKYLQRTAPQFWDSSLSANDGIGFLSAERVNKTLEDLRLYLAIPVLGTNVTEYLLAEPQRQAVFSNARQDKILQTMLADRDLSKTRKALLLSAGCPGTAAFIYSGAQSNESLRIRSECYIEGIRLRALLPVMEIDPGFEQSCACGMGDMEEVHQAHSLLCTSTSGARKVRHDHIVDALAEFIKWVDPAATVEKEVTLPNARADLRVTVGANVTWVDVSVVAPNGLKYLQLGSDKKQLVAADERERQKLLNYEPAKAASIGSVTVVPFVLELTGAFGNAACKFLDKLSDIVTALPRADDVMARKRRYFKKLISAYLVTGNAHCFAASRKKMRAVRRGNATEPVGTDQADDDDPHKDDSSDFDGGNATNGDANSYTFTRPSNFSSSSGLNDVGRALGQGGNSAK